MTVSLLERDLGYTEQPPGSNITKFGERLFGPGKPAAWCCAALTCEMVDAGVPGAFLEASVGRFRNRCAAEGRIVDLSGALAALAAGRVVAVGFEWEHDSWPDHIGQLLGQVDADHVHTVEANSHGPDGTDEIAYHTRPLSAVAFFAAFDAPAGAAPSTPPAHPAPAPVHDSFPALPRFMVLDQRGSRGGQGHTNHGDWVWLWQRQMAKRGWRIAVDGVFGAGSASVAAKFQKEKGLGVDGQVGQQTWAATFTAPVTR